MLRDMALSTRRQLLGAAAASAGLLSLPHSLRKALTVSGCPRHVATRLTDGGPALIMVVAAGVDIVPAAIPEPYRIGLHVCYPPSRRACWCGGWHGPDDPADFVIAAGESAHRWRFGEDHPGLAILATGQRPHPDLSTLHVPAGQLVLTTTRIIEQIAEGLLVPGIAGYDLRDLCAMVERGRPLHFAYATSAGVVAATAKVLTASGDWLPNATNLVVRCTSCARTLLHDVGVTCDKLLLTVGKDANAIFSLTIPDGASPSVVGVLAVC